MPEEGSPKKDSPRRGNSRPRQKRPPVRLVFFLNHDLAEELGQIAHLDQHRANGQEDNLAWMCLEHHSLFDSQIKQHKNYTNHEAKAAVG
ncbi:MAG TPA: hypothetical protein VMI94_29115 [Bryobacteraceae bacterium]|nr:hypothetical protein [Bryobacteraceae bacterium]